ncbi:MAG: biotin/lipoyl-containing protein [Patescibacteria group bacterium]
MDLKKVRQIVSLLQEHPTIAELEVRNMRGFSKIRVRMSPSDSSASQPQTAEKLAVQEQLCTIESPSVGWFLAAADLEENPPLIEGSFVSQGETVGYIEIHGLKNPVVSQFEGTIRQIHAETGQPVEYGQRLYTISLSGPSG